MGMDGGWEPLLFAAVSNFYRNRKIRLRFISNNQDLLIVESDLSSH